MRTTNNQDNQKNTQSNDKTWYVVLDTDTQEYLVEWDDWEGSAEVWAAMDLWDDGGVEEFSRFQPGALCTSPEIAMDLLKSVGEALCERFPEEQINLMIQRVSLVTTCSIDVEDHGEVQTFGEEEEEEEREGLTPEPRSWTVTQSDEDELVNDDSGWGLQYHKPMKPKKSKDSKKAKKSRSN
jgi:hypothetical protein